MSAPQPVSWFPVAPPGPAGRLPPPAWLAGGALDRNALRQILACREPQEIEAIRAAAEQTLLQHCGDTVRLRGLIEFSNRCVADCHYCGIRRSNRAVARYTLTLDEVLACARWCAERGYGSLVLQSGERRDARFVAWVTTAIRAIKAATRSAALPEGLGITLSLGEQSPATYAAWRAAGAHRYLLRIETSDPALFARLHPPAQSWAARLACLQTLKALDYQVGTGVMIGLPGQTLEHLVDDLLFFQQQDVDMLGMGPYIPHAQAPLPECARLLPAAARLQLALQMIAAARLLLPEINIAATTALQALAEDGREQGLRFGANVLMPQVTPPQVRRLYTLYDGKPCLEDSPAQCAECLHGRILASGRRVLSQQWGDSAHALRRQGAPASD